MAFCLSCKKHTNNMASRSVTTTNKVLRQKPNVGYVFQINQDF